MCMVTAISATKMMSDGKTHNHIDHILMDRRWNLSILNV